MRECCSSVFVRFIAFACSFGFGCRASLTGSRSSLPRAAKARLQMGKGKSGQRGSESRGGDETGCANHHRRLIIDEDHIA